MNTTTQHQPAGRKRARRRTQPNRRGSTLLIVMVLMGMLSLLGVIFYTFAAQERSNSEYYSEAAKNREEAGLSADVLMDWGLQQIIVGTDSRLKHSALWGSRHSMLSNMLGVGDHRPGDTHPYNGEGVTVTFDASGNPQVEFPTGTSANYLLGFNDSPSANNQTERKVNNTSQYPQPDVGYSYPDINNVFLAYVGKTRDANGKIHQVVIPSYFRPQYLRNASGPITDWYNNAATVNKMMRAHPNHVCILPDSSSSTPPNRYFTTDANAVAVTGNPSARAFPFAPMLPTYDTSSGGSGPAFSTGQMGVWTRTDPDPTPQEDTDQDGVIDTGEDTDMDGVLDGDHAYHFDIDLDGDGIREAVWMDLDFPAQENANGDLFVPLYAVTIVDLDSLINLNTAGHTTKTQTESLSGSSSSPLSISSAAGTPFGGSGFLSASNLGMTGSEVNPAWALTGRPALTSASPAGDAGSAAALNDHGDFFGASPTDLSSLATPGPVPTFREMANMELLWLKVGRAKFKSGAGSAIDDIYPGVYGEEHILAQNYNTGGPPYFGYLPRPGVSVQDDNGDLNEGMTIALVSGANNWTNFMHPLDFAGLGSYVLPLSGSPKRGDFFTSGKSNYLRYNQYANNDSADRVRWGAANVSTNLMTNSFPNANGDDPAEVAHYAEDKRDNDDPLKAEEMLALQLSNTELNNLTVSSRVLNLAPFNFAKDSSTNARGEDIRKRFTTQSNDRKNYGFPYSPTRSWEYSLDSTSNTYKFPPQFGSVARYASTDPLRPAVRAMLEIEALSNKTYRWQRKLSVNGLTTYSGNQLSVRPLYNHPDDPGATAVNTTNYPNVANPNYTPVSAGEFEFCARRDRQQMARDIYVLLYLLGHGTDGTDTATTVNAGGAIYSNARLREMAQFAVNVVDAMDRDNVITRFEYDKDLSDGWNLDDNPYASPEYAAYATSDMNYSVNHPRDSASHGEVFGVERLDLTLSEALMIHTEALTTNTSATSYDDMTARHFAYFELRNHGPNSITFDDKEAWQLLVKQEPTAGTPLWERRVSFKTGAGAVAADGIFTVGSADFDRGGATPGRSNFEVDDSGGGSPTRKAPGGTGVCSVDMIDPATPSAVFLLEEADYSSGTPPTITDRTATKGQLLGAFSGGTPTGTYSDQVIVQIRRRAHPTRSKVATADEQDNPWVTIDQTQFDIRTFDITAGPTTGTTIQGQLDDLRSRERPQPLYRVGETDLAVDQGSYIYNTLGSNNNATGAGTFNLWQPHFDRDYPSIIDLLHVPVIGPHSLTQAGFGLCRQNPYEQYNDVVLGVKTAAGKVLLPAPVAADRTYDNRWHRLFEFLEVPTRMNKNLGIGSDLSIPRVPGRINLNMLRHPEVYAGLIDDYRLVSLNLTPGLAGIADDPEAGLLPDQTGEGGRDWWQEFIKARDAKDPYWAATTPPGAASPTDIWLPGLPGAHPFRSPAYLGKSGTLPSVEDSIFRSLPFDSGQTSTRRLLEVGNQSEHQTTGSNAIDPYIRHRLLSKIHGNSTTRSHNYAVFIAVKYFLAGEDNGAIRIGGPLNGKPDPEHRGFFVVDRSKLEKGANAGVGGYDFRAFIDYRRIIETQ